MTTEQVIAWATVVQAGAVLGALAFAWWQLRETASTRKDQARAYVVAFFEFRPELRQFPDLVVANMGATAAYDIRLDFEPELGSSLDDKGGPAITDVGMVSSGVPTLAPGMRVSTLFDSMIERPKDWEDQYRAIVCYRDRAGDEHEDEFVLDLGSLRHSTYIDEKGLRQLNREMEKLNQTVDHIRSGFGGPMPVVVEPRSDYVERQHSEFAERQAARDAREAKKVVSLAESEAPEADTEEAGTDGSGKS